MSVNVDRITLLELDLDTRLHDLWREAGDVDEWTLQMVAAFMRAAYGAGYVHALSEPVRGQLCRDHGYQTPKRSARP